MTVAGMGLVFTDVQPKFVRIKVLYDYSVLYGSFFHPPPQIQLPLHECH